MHKEHLAQDENSNPREGPVMSRRKDRLSPGEHDMNQLNRGRPKTGSWDSNGFGPEIEVLAGRTEESVPLSPSNSLNLRHLRGCERDSPGRGLQRPPPPQYHPNYYPTHHHHHHRTSYSGHRKGYWDYESQYRDGKRKAWVPRPGGGPHTQRPRNREALNSTETPCADTRPEQTAGDKSKNVSRQPSPPAEKEPATDSWLLFKPLPVFPVDSSSARTLPKISYASKVKENLDGKGLVPSSALRTASTLPNCLLNAAQTGPQSDATAGPHTGSLSSSSCSSLSSSSPPSPVSQENLGAIFQNEWGLSFINEPGAGQAASAEVREHQEEGTPGGGVEGGGGGGGDEDKAPPVTALVRLSHGFYIEGGEPEATTMENPRDWEAMVTYSLQEWNRVWNLHKKDPARVVVYAETLDGKG
ncbi:FMR1-interacting protein NUFIP2-like [Eleutherodactylus coqui]|uniref:FMR1-interacting protein NUFIP2-like n=1 Tax=Eleutherodactylus coqui TaxID=57060 RepID=UPI0034638379